MPTLTKSAIVDAIYERTGRHRTEIKEYVDALLEVMIKVLKKDHSLLSCGLGKLEAYGKFLFEAIYSRASI